MRNSSFRLAFLVVLAVSAVGGWLVLEHLVLPGRTPRWDEVAHALRGALIVHDLRELDWTGLALDTYLQVYWPPIHSWVLAAAFLVAGQSLEVARAVSVLAFVLLAPTLFLTGHVVAPRHGILAGGIAAGLALTSPGLITSAAESMLELPGVLAMSATILVYCALERDRDASPRAHALLGVGLVVTYLVKSNYGILLIIGIVLSRLIDADFRVRRLATKQTLYAAFPLAIFCVVWFAFPPKVMWTWNMLVNTPWGEEEARGVRGLLYFPRVIVDFSGSLWMAAVLWGGLVMAWRTRRLPGITLLVVVPITLLLIGTFHHTKLPRHILPVFPPLFVLTGIAGAELWASLEARGRSLRVAAIGGLAVVGLLQAGTLTRRDWFPTETPVADVLDFVSRLVRENPRVLVLGTQGTKPMPPAIDWHLTAVEELVPVTAAGTLMDSHGMRRLVGSIRRSPAPGIVRASAKRVGDRYREASAARSLYVGYRSVRSRSQFESALQETLERGDSPRSIVIVVGTSDSTQYSPSFFAPGLARAGFREVSVREFARAGSRVYLYSRTGAPAAAGSSAIPATRPGSPSAGTSSGR
jgi:4-amino-4-deoxy-L-arabinose transferase-like glycosyltransferase